MTVDILKNEALDALCLHFIIVLTQHEFNRAGVMSLFHPSSFSLHTIFKFLGFPGLCGVTML